jgi:hypothetical protein
MSGVGQYGTGPIAAQFQGFINATPSPNNLTTYSAQNCSVVTGTTGQIILTIDAAPSLTAVGTYQQGVDQYTYAVTVRQFGQTPQRVDIAYGTPAGNDILLTFGGTSAAFGTPAFPGQGNLFNVIVTQCTDGVSNLVPPIP